MGAPHQPRINQTLEIVRPHRASLCARKIRTRSAWQSLEAFVHRRDGPLGMGIRTQK